MKQKNNASVGKVKTKASDLFILSLFAYLTLLVQPVVNYLIVWTPLIDNLPLGDKLWTLIMNIVCIIAWALLGYWLISLGKKECGYDVFEKCTPPGKMNIIAAAAVAVAFVGLMLLLGGGFYLPYGSEGCMGVVYTPVYYVFQIFHACVLTMVIAFGHKAGDVAFGERRFPYGGAVLGICMAVYNLISGFSSVGSGAAPVDVLISAAVVLCCALVYGTVYLLIGKKPIYAAPVIAIMFLLI